MATIIKNFKPSSTCWQCRFLTETEWRCLAADRHIYKDDNPKPKWCPIVEVVNPYCDYYDLGECEVYKRDLCCDNCEMFEVRK